MFQNVRINEDVEKGAQGGPSFNTTVMELSSGFEKRNVNWERSRGSWDLSYGMDNKATHEAVLAFFYARQGRANGFRFKDWTDFQIGVTTPETPQEIDIADGVRDKFQVVRRYSSLVNFDRAITRIVATTGRVFVDSVEQVSGFTLDDDTGVIDFSVAPLVGKVIQFIGEFDVPVRFDIDHLNIMAVRDDAMTFPAVPIVELKEALVDVS